LRLLLASLDRREPLRLPGLSLLCGLRSSRRDREALHADLRDGEAMSIFYVGQTVRIARSDYIQTQVGRVGLIVARGRFRSTNRKFYEFELRIEGRIWVADGWELEPIIPDGLESIEEINALYEPTPEDAKA